MFHKVFLHLEISFFRLIFFCRIVCGTYSWLTDFCSFILWLCHLLPLGLHCFWSEVIDYLNFCFTVGDESFFSYCFQDLFFLPLIFNSMTVLCLGVDLFVFILLMVHWTSWMYTSMCFIKIGKFWAVIPSNIFSASFFLPSCSFGIAIVLVLVWLMLSHRFLRLLIFLHSSFCSLDWIIFIDLF